MSGVAVEQGVGATAGGCGVEVWARWRLSLVSSRACLAK